ncbi:MAG: hypothetical protein ACI31O_02295 [Limosilactobacillus vaginalis]|uniref:hypothetical protein n=1 Tax=Limosilactobacillus vaginalis TaxID=1633 RepID=UPI003F00A86D
MRNIVKMQSKFKKKLVDNLMSNRKVVFFVLISIIGLIGRIVLFKAISGDFRIFLHPWYVKIDHYGLRALSHQVGNYGILYQFIILLMTYLPIRDLYAYKIVSVIFDYVLAISAALLARKLSSNKENVFLLCYSVILLLPTVILNSAWWAQCDSIYASFLCLSLLYLFDDRYALSFIFYGLAFAFKLQAVFLLPFLLLIYFVKKNVFITHYLLALFTFWLTGLPGYLFGRSPFSLFGIYWKGQITIQNTVHKEYFNLSCIFGNPNLIYSSWLAHFLLMLMLGALVIGFFFFLNSAKHTNFDLLLLAAWSLYTCMMFMPYLQQRYGYVLDILLIVITCIWRKYLIVAIPELILSFVSYMPALFIPKLFINNNNIPLLIILSCLALLIYSFFTYLVFIRDKVGED